MSSTLNIEDIKPLKGQMNCYLFENSYTNIPLTLYYIIEIPLRPFNSGHDYVPQPTHTKFVIDWIVFNNEKNSQQERNWKNLVGRKFNLSYENQMAEGSIYLGSQHCQMNTEIYFLSLNGITFDIELTADISFNIKTKNQNNNKLVKIKTLVDYSGFKACYNQLPTFQKAPSKMALASTFVDLSVYKTVFKEFKTKHDNCKLLKPKY